MPVTRSMTGRMSRGSAHQTAQHDLVPPQQPAQPEMQTPSDAPVPPQQSGSSAPQPPTEEQKEQLDEVPHEHQVFDDKSVRSRRSVLSIRKATMLEELAMAMYEQAEAKEEKAEAKKQMIKARIQKLEAEEERSETQNGSRTEQTQQWVDKHSNVAWDIEEDLQEEFKEKPPFADQYHKNKCQNQPNNTEQYLKREEQKTEIYRNQEAEDPEETKRYYRRKEIEEYKEAYRQKTEAKIKQEAKEKELENLCDWKVKEETKEDRKYKEKKPEEIQKKEDQQINLSELASAIAQAARGQQTTIPRYIGELPFFNGAHQEWLAYRAAYLETEKFFTDVENTARLRRSLKGRALEAVHCLLIANAKPEQILENLETRFGRPDSIALSELDRLRSLQRTTEAPQEICLFASKVQNSVATLQALNRNHYLYNPEILKSLTQKLTPTLRTRWLDVIDEQPEKDPDLVTFSNFIAKEARRVGRFASPERYKEENRFEKEHRREFNRGQSFRREPYRGQPFRREQHREENREPRREFYRNKTSPTRENRGRDRIYRTTEQRRDKEYRPPPPTCDICKDSTHETEKCKRITEANNNQRWDLAKEYFLCFRCLKKRTQTHKCKMQLCRVDGCERSHHPLLHFTPNKKEETTTQAEERVTTAAEPKQFNAFLKIIPVKVKGPEGELETFALLDDGSTVTLIDSKIAAQIGCEGPIDPLQIESVAGEKLDTSTSKRVKFQIIGAGGEFPIRARTISQMKLAPQAVNAEDIEHCQHLQDIREKIQYKEGKPTLLIGQDNWQFLIANTVKRGAVDQPVASLTLLGWVLHGVNTRSLGRQVNHCYHLSQETTNEDNLDEEIRRYFSMDSLGIMPRKPQSDPEERALKILRNKTVERPEGGYETGLLWKKDNTNLPNNYDQALKRLYGIEKKLDKNPELKASYEKQIDDLIKKGYAEEANSPPKPGKTWYLPHFAVFHPSKPGKVRLVYDAAAKSGGTSLNDHLLPGPDLLQSLPGVLMRFRQHSIAVAADIEEMFLRIGIIEEDRDALRFLWRQNRREGPPIEYRMKSVIFGAASSPCTALYIKNFNAEKHKEEYPEAREAIVLHHYMDDYLQSFNNVEEAIKIAREVQLVHQKGNFNLRKWCSNKQELLNALKNTSDENTEEVKLDDGTKEEKVLGLIWKPKNDTLGFNLNFSRVPEDIVQGKRTPTKREALKTVMSLYDPLGLVSPITIQGKQILQETWRHGTGWDEELPKEVAQKWKMWIEDLKKLRSIEISRHHPEFGDAKERELHTFVDASETAYAATVYWRIVDKEGNVHVSLAFAKAKVAPLKLTSIPRLELQAAVLGTRSAKTVTEEYQMKANRRIFWTDSKTVLKWLRSGPRVFKSFVAHRVAEIEEETTVNDWRWIPTTLNVADDATRNTPANFTMDHRWFCGPEFLLNDPESWPKEKETDIGKTGEERVHIAQKTSMKLTESLPDISKFSSWLRLIRTTARVLQFLQLLKASKERVNYKRTIRRKEKDPNWGRRRTRGAGELFRQQEQSSKTHNILPLDGEFMWKAEGLWVKASQQESFSEEIAALTNQREVPKDSRLRQLALIMEDCVIKLKSRISAAVEISSQQKQPAILDGDHVYTRLYLLWIHQRLQHSGTEMIVNEARQRYWILKLRPTAKSIVKSCLKCRIKKAVPTEPPTGNHPHTRLAHHRRPFTFTGVDYFGPLSVTVGRSHQKRYVALFTCLTTRAIHLEIAANLSTDSAVLALRRFIARRGRPTEIYSDNGTNLRGADRELQEALQDEASNYGITWKFLPPGAPFMGGAWERLVRSVKTALYSVLQERHPQEETLATLLCEVEYTVNNRPLTHVSVSPDDDETLTPNHFLLGGSGGIINCGNFTDIDLKLRHQWRQAQRLADIFWERWLKEYLPELQYRREPRGQGKPIQENDLVLIVDPNLPRNTWPRGKIIKLYPGEDGIVRAVDVQTAGGIMRRPTKRLVVLPVLNQEVVTSRTE